MITKEKVIKSVTEELDEALSSINAEVYRWEDKIVDVDLKNETITIKFNFHIVKEDDYVGLSIY